MYPIPIHANYLIKENSKRAMNIDFYPKIIFHPKIIYLITYLRGTKRGRESIQVFVGAKVSYIEINTFIVYLLRITEVPS